MTGKEIYKDALALLGQRLTDNPLWDELAVSWLNMVLEEALSTENTIRRYLDEETLPQLEVAQRVSDLDTELVYRPRLRTALVNGMTAQLWDEGHDRYKAQDYRARFAAALMAAEEVRPEKVVDVYA